MARSFTWFEKFGEVLEALPDETKAGNWFRGFGNQRETSFGNWFRETENPIQYSTSQYSTGQYKPNQRKPSQDRPRGRALS